MKNRSHNLASSVSQLKLKKKFLDSKSDLNFIDFKEVEHNNRSTILWSAEIIFQKKSKSLSLLIALIFGKE